MIKHIKHTQNTTTPTPQTDDNLPKWDINSLKSSPVFVAWLSTLPTEFIRIDGLGLAEVRDIVDKNCLYSAYLVSVINGKFDQIWGINWGWSCAFRLFG